LGVGVGACPPWRQSRLSVSPASETDAPVATFRSTPSACSCTASRSTGQELLRASLGMGCSPSSARYAPGMDDGTAGDVDLLVRKPSDAARTKPLPPSHLKEKRTASSSPTPSAGSVDAVSPVESPSPERAAAAPGESPQCPARIRASPSRTPSGSAKRRRGSVPQLRLELGVDAPVPEVSSNDEGGSGSEEDEEEAYTREEVVHFAKTLLGLDPEVDADLLWIAEEALRAPLPLGWVELEDPKTGVPYYHSTVDNTVTWDHPLDGHYKLMAARAQLAKPGRKDEMETAAGAHAPDSVEGEMPASKISTGDTSTDENAAVDDGKISPVAQRVRATSRDLSTLKQLFKDGLLDERVYQAKQEEVLRSCLSQLAPSETDGESIPSKAAEQSTAKLAGENVLKANITQSQQQKSQASAAPAPMSAAAAAAAALRPNGEPPSALWLRLHEKVMAGPNKSAAAVAAAALAAAEGAKERLPPAEELGAPRARDPVKVAMAAVHGAKKQVRLSRQQMVAAS
jgi:hypothetical protein